MADATRIPSPALRERVAEGRVRAASASSVARDNARRLRRNSTDAEQRLWRLLRDRRLAGYRFRRQYPIGPFIVDFACTRHRLIVEADGSQHLGNEADALRTAFLECNNRRLLRFWNDDMANKTDAVLTVILEALTK
jgi:2-isopropylmalate synthase